MARTVGSKNKKTIRRENAELNSHHCCMQLNEDKCKKNNGDLNKSNFYVSDSLFYGGERMFPICKNCIKDYIYDSNGDVIIGNFMTLLRLMDIPYKHEIYVKSLEHPRETLGTYLRILKISHSYDTLSYDNSDNFGEEEKKDLCVYDDEILIARWGLSYSQNDLIWLENTYTEWCKNNEVDKLAVQKLVQMICIKELEIRKARESGKATDKLEKSLLELMNSSHLTPKTISANNESESTRTFGQWIKDIEQNRPAEFFEDKALYDDYDGIKGYFEEFILRPMRNLIGNSREFSREYQSIEFEEQKDSDDLDW